MERNVRPIKEERVFDNGETEIYLENFEDKYWFLERKNKQGETVHIEDSNGLRWNLEDDKTVIFTKIPLEDDEVAILLEDGGMAIIRPDEEEKLSVELYQNRIFDHLPLFEPHAEVDKKRYPLWDLMSQSKIYIAEGFSTLAQAEEETLKWLWPQGEQFNPLTPEDFGKIFGWAKGVEEFMERKATNLPRG